MALTDDIPAAAAARAVPLFCRLSIEAACTERGVKQYEIVEAQIFHRECQHPLYFMLDDINVVPLRELVVEWNQLILLMTPRFIQAGRVI